MKRGQIGKRHIEWGYIWKRNTYGEETYEENTYTEREYMSKRQI